MRVRWLVVAIVGALAVAACGSSSGGGNDSLGSTTTADRAASRCKGASLQPTEIGITAKTITVTVMADVGSPLSPGLFQGSIDGVKAWAALVNAHGGLACRQVEVRTADSMLNPNEAKNGVVTACGNSVVLLGTTAVFLNDMRPVEGCKDKQGRTTGIPDLPALQTEPSEQCSPVSFSVVQQGTSCPYSGTGVRDYEETTGQVTWFKKHVGEPLHGVYVVVSDLPSTITASTPVFASFQKLGVKRDKEFGMSALSTQSQFTPVIQAIKSTKANFVITSLDAPGNVKLRKEAAAQGATDVKVWTCVQACYSEGFISDGGPAVEGEYAYISFLPIEDAGSNATLDSLLKYDPKADSFGIEAFASGLLFQKVVDDIVAKDGPNAVTRAEILAQLATVHRFDSGGLLGDVDIASRKTGRCFVVVQVQNGKWVRVDPVKKGTFDCDQPDGLTKLSLDPVKAYQPG